MHFYNNASFQKYFFSFVVSYIFSFWCAIGPIGYIWLYETAFEHTLNNGHRIVSYVHKLFGEISSKLQLDRGAYGEEDKRWCANLCFRKYHSGPTALTVLVLRSTVMYKSLTNAKRPCGCSVLCLRPKNSLCNCTYGPHYARIVVFSL